MIFSSMSFYRHEWDKVFIASMDVKSNGPDRNRTCHTDLARICRPLGTCWPSFPCSTLRGTSDRRFMTGYKSPESMTLEASGDGGNQTRYTLVANERRSLSCRPQNRRQALSHCRLATSTLDGCSANRADRIRTCIEQRSQIIGLLLPHQPPPNVKTMHPEGLEPSTPQGDQQIKSLLLCRYSFGCLK